MADDEQTSKPTIKDVARLAGVSTMTVSRALRMPDKVAEATRLRIAAAIEQLAYVPDLAAGGLARRRSGLIAVLLPSLRHSGFADTVQGLSDYLRDYDYHVLIGNSDYSKDEESSLLRTILGRRPEGILLISSLYSPQGRRLLSRSRVPVVETWDFPQQPIDMVVGFSHQDCGYAMTHHLYAQGYRNIGFIGGEAATDPRGELRRQGYLCALRELGLVDHYLITTAGKPLDIADGAAGIEQLIQRYPEVDAVFCMSDIVAVGALLACQRQGWAVPKRIAIAGFGDFDISTHVLPPLTTVSLPGYLIGQRAAAHLVTRLTNEALSEPVINVGFQIIDRAST